MTTTIRLKIQKDIDPATEKKILKLKGSLITNGYTDIVHIDDEGLEYHINYFIVATEKKEEAISFIDEYRNGNSLDNLLWIL
jgi:hypothetical protein